MPRPYLQCAHRRLRASKTMTTTWLNDNCKHKYIIIDLADFGRNDKRLEFSPNSFFLLFFLISWEPNDFWRKVGLFSAISKVLFDLFQNSLKIIISNEIVTLAVIWWCCPPLLIAYIRIFFLFHSAFESTVAFHPPIRRETTKDHLTQLLISNSLVPIESHSYTQAQA